MTSLTANLENGDQHQILLRLKNLGVNLPDYIEIGKDPDLADEVAALLLQHRWFTKPDEQKELLLRINREVWHNKTIDEEAIESLGNPPEWPLSTPERLYTVTLVYETGDPVETFKRNWAACVYIFGEDRVFIDGGRDLSEWEISPHTKAFTRPKGLRWIIAELGRTNFGLPANLAHAKFYTSWVEDMLPLTVYGIGQELPAIAAMHQRWAESLEDSHSYEDESEAVMMLDYKRRIVRLPCLLAPDLEVCRVGHAVNLRDIPVLYYRHGLKHLSLGTRSFSPAISRDYPFGAGYILE